MTSELGFRIGQTNHVHLAFAVDRTESGRLRAGLAGVIAAGTEYEVSQDDFFRVGGFSLEGY